MYPFNSYQQNFPQNFTQNYQQNYQPTMPQQQILQVNGKASIDTIRMSPNSSLLALDTSAPIVWMCVSDGVGAVTATPCDIKVHEEKQAPDLEDRIRAIENSIAEMEEKINAKSNIAKSKSKQNSTDGIAD